MLGIVPVKVLGPCKANDPLYASGTEPGAAVSGFNTQVIPNVNDESLIGYAFQSHETDDNEVTFYKLLINHLNIVANFHKKKPLYFS